MAQMVYQRLPWIARNRAGLLRTRSGHWRDDVNEKRHAVCRSCGTFPDAQDIEEHHAIYPEPVRPRFKTRAVTPLSSGTNSGPVQEPSRIGMKSILLNNGRGVQGFCLAPVALMSFRQGIQADTPQSAEVRHFRQA